MPWLESAALAVSIPAGCRYDPGDKIGLANFTCEMVQRGCGTRDSRQFVEDLEWLGVDDSSSVGVYSSQFAGTMPASSLHESLAIYADMLRRPLLPADQFEDGRMVCFQEVHSLEDDLAHRVMIELRQRFYGDPIGRSSTGTMESIASINSDDVRTFFENAYRPNDAIISVAGKINWNELCETVDRLFSDWQPKTLTPSPEVAPSHGSHHIEFESQQTQIALAYNSIPYSHPDYFLARTAVGALSGGMSSRLFSEVREKRGLCYAVGASMHSSLVEGCVVGSSGTTAERAQETLDVMMQEIQRLEKGITDDELARVKVQVRSAMVMQQESSRARAGSNVGDWLHLKRVRSRDEINEIIMNQTVDQINNYVADNPLVNPDLVTLGPEPLEIAHGVS